MRDGGHDRRGGGPARQGRASGDAGGFVYSTATVKAECDLCVTSANAAEMIGMLPPDSEILFVTDRNLGRHCAGLAGRNVTCWNGFCPVHQRMTCGMVERRRREFPDTELLIHPEAPPEVTAMADHALSTGGILRHVRRSPKETFIIATEVGILHRLEKENPGKRFIPLTGQAVCPQMKLIRLPDVLRSRAETPIRRMLNRRF